MTPSVRYGVIVRGHIDRHGNLRLYRRGRVFARQAIFHPAGEWATFTISHTGDCVVALTPADSRRRLP
jgi:hypothetical protein